MKKILTKNHYPPKLVDRLLSKARCQNWGSTPNNPETSPEPPDNVPQYIISTYIPGFSEKLQKSINHITDKVKLGLAPPNKVDVLLTNMKARTPTEHQFGVYIIPCNNS